MSKKYDSLWTLMEKYHFNSTEMVDNDLICIICQGIMRNAHKSLCSCAFCFDCLERYSMGSVNYCPGSVKNCSQSIENVHEYLQSDDSKNERILNIVVKCPVKSCDFEGVLSIIEDHISTHNEDIKKEELFNDAKIDKMSKSIEYLKKEMIILLKDSSKKSKLISEMRKEIEDLKETNYSTQQNMENIQKEFKTNKCQLVILQELVEKLLENRKKSDEIVKCDEVNTKTVKGNSIEKPINKDINNNNNKAEKEFTNVNKQLFINPRKSDSNCIEEKSISNNSYKIPENISKKASEFSNITNENVVRKRDQTNIIKDLRRRESLPQKPYDKKDNLNVTIENSKPNTFRTVVMTNEKFLFDSTNVNDNSFFWKVFLEGNKDKPIGIKTSIFSRSFFSAENGYQMKLVIQPNERYLSVGFVIIKGKFDDYLSWPMKQNVNICLLDYKSEKEIFSIDLNAFDDFNIFKKPDYDWNTPYVAEDLIKLNSIFNNGQLYRNNSFIIRCIVNKF